MAPPLRVLFVTLTNDVGSDRVVSEMGRHGAVCAVLGPLDSYAGCSRFVSVQFPLMSVFGSWGRTLGLRQRLSAIVDSWIPDRIVPLDELAGLTLRTIASSGKTPTLRNLLIASLGRPDGYMASCHRVPFMQTAARLGIRIPAFQGNGRSPGFPVMVKRDHSSGSGGVAIAADATALRVLLGRARWKTAAKRLMAVVAGFQHGDAPILVQEHVSGRLAMRTVACRDGVVLDGMSFVAVAQSATLRGSTVLQAIQNAEMDNAVRAIVAALGCSGFVSFDFIIDDETRAFLIEMNARPIGSTHLGRSFGHDLCRAFVDQHPAGASTGDAVGRDIGRPVALFPKELERDPDSPCVAAGSDTVHDVPWDEPAIVDVYVKHLQRLHPTRAADIGQYFGRVERGQGDAAPWSQAERTELCL